MTSVEQIAYIAALQWHLDQGIDEILADAPGLLARAPLKKDIPVERRPARADSAPASFAGDDLSGPDYSIPDYSGLAAAPIAGPVAAHAASPAPLLPAGNAVQGTPALRDEAIKRAEACQSLEALKEAIAGFEGLALRRTASNLVFADGNPQAPIMLIGDMPNAEEDRTGRPFAGDDGVLMDKILKAIAIDRSATAPQHSIYMSYALNWRPPGGRSPSPQELELTLPFIERHIMLVKPQLLVLCGNLTAKLLLDSAAPLSKLRGQWHPYRPRLLSTEQAPILALCTYTPAYLLNTPGQKKAVWADMLALAAERRARGIVA